MTIYDNSGYFKGLNGDKTERVGIGVCYGPIWAVHNKVGQRVAELISGCGTVAETTNTQSDIDGIAGVGVFNILGFQGNLGYDISNGEVTYALTYSLMHFWQMMIK